MVSRRQSNIELLRIISMMAVILVHLDGASLGLPTPGGISDCTASDAWRIVTESITIIGVNCFTLISGYFGIRARLSGLLRFTLMCIFYAVGIYLAANLFLIFVQHQQPQFFWKGLLESVMVYTHTDLWYVPAYLLLYLLSPMINAAVDSLPLNKFRLWLALFILANVWCGWLWEGGFNPSGYTAFQLIMMYLIGRYLALRFRDGMPRRMRVVSISVYVASTLLTAVIALWMKPGMVYAYNAPWVIISSVALFLFFTTLRIRSGAINTLATGAFAAYLIHKNPLIWGNFIKPTALDYWADGSLWQYTIFCLVFASLIYLVSTAVELVRQALAKRIG